MPENGGCHGRLAYAVCSITGFWALYTRMSYQSSYRLRVHKPDVGDRLRNWGCSSLVDDPDLRH